MSQLSRRDFLRYQGALGLAAVGGAGGLWALLSRSGAAAASTFDVTQYGAFPNGTDATPGFQRAIAAAQAAGGGTVSVPAGTFEFTSAVPIGFAASLRVHGAGAVQIVGSGRDSTFLVQRIPGQTLISLQVPGSSVQNLTMDCQTYEGGTCLGVSTDNTLLKGARALGSKAQKAFTLYYVGGPGATQDNPVYNHNNQVIDVIVHDEICDDGFSFSYQEGGLISQITHFGSRLAIYVCTNLQVDTYDYTPNFACNVNREVTDCFYITPPSDTVSFTNLTTSGQGGIIDGNAQVRMTTNVAISNLQFTQPGFRLEVGNVSGLTVTGGDFSGNSLYFDPPVSATGVAVDGVVMPAIRFAQPSSAQVQTTFNDCSFPALVINGNPSPTFRNLSRGPTQVTVNGGTFSNQAGGFAQGSTTTYTVTNIAPINTAAPTITGVAQVNNVQTAQPGTWLGDTPTYTFQWNLDGAPIPGATSNTYTPPSADAGHTLSVTVTATNSTGSTALTSSARQL